MDFGEVLTKAWQIIWKYKVLWIFGILASCGGNGSGSNANFHSSGGNGNFPRAEHLIDGLQGWQIAMIIAAISLLVILLIIIVAVLSTVGRIGLIQGTTQADQGAASLRFSQLLSDGKPFFWRVLGLNILFGLIVLVALALLFGFSAGFAALTFGIGLICLLPLFCILIPAIWFLAIIIEQANIALVVEDLNITAALRRGLDVVMQNLGSMIVMGLILSIGINLLIGFIIALPLFALIGPVILGAIIGGDRAFGTGLVLALLGFLAYLPVLILAGGIMRAYIDSAWTLTFLRLTSSPSLETGPEEPTLLNA